MNVRQFHTSTQVFFCPFQYIELSIITTNQIQILFLHHQTAIGKTDRIMQRVFIQRHTQFINDIRLKERFREHQQDIVFYRLTDTFIIGYRTILPRSGHHFPTDKGVFTDTCQQTSTIRFFIHQQDNLYAVPFVISRTQRKTIHKRFQPVTQRYHNAQVKIRQLFHKAKRISFSFHNSYKFDHKISKSSRSYPFLSASS